MILIISPNHSNLGRLLACGDVEGDVTIWFHDVDSPPAPDMFAENEGLPPNKECWRIFKHLRLLQLLKFNTFRKKKKSK